MHESMENHYKGIKICSNRSPISRFNQTLYFELCGKENRYEYEIKIRGVNTLPLTLFQQGINNHFEKNIDTVGNYYRIVKERIPSLELRLIQANQSGIQSFQNYRIKN